jgi:hypothetical protein
MAKQSNYSTLCASDDDTERIEKRIEELSYQVITAGYRAMLMKLHPDHGGNAEDVILLEDVRTMLNQDTKKRWR